MNPEQSEFRNSMNDEVVAAIQAGGEENSNAPENNAAQSPTIAIPDNPNAAQVAQALNDNKDAVSIPLAEIAGGKYKTKDELYADIRRLETFKPEDLQQIELLRKENEQAKLKLSEVENAFTVKDETLYRLSVLKEKNPDKYAIAAKLVFGNDEPVDVLKAKFVSENPAYKDSMDAVDRRVKAAYPDLFGEDADKDSQEYKDALIELRADAEKAKKSLLSDLESVELPKRLSDEDKAKLETEKQGQEQQRKDKLTGTWIPKFKQLDADIKKIAITSKDKDGKDVTLFEADIPGKDRQDIIVEIGSHILSNEVEYNDEFFSGLRKAVEDTYIRKNIDKIISKAQEDAVTAYRATLTNPSAIRQEQRPAAEGEKSHIEEARGHVEKIFDINP